MKFLTAALLVLFAIIPLHANEMLEISVDGEIIDLKPHLGIVASGYMANPLEDFKAGYDNFTGFEVGAAISLTIKERNNHHVGGYYFKFSYDKIPLKDELIEAYALESGTEATMMGFYFGEGVGIPIIISDHFSISPFLGSAIGAAVFKLDDEDFLSMGEHTHTELLKENDHFNVASYSQLGLIVSGANHVSLQFSYDLASVERAWMFWHSMVNGIASSILVKGVPSLLGRAFPDEVRESLPFQLTELAYQMAATYFWYNFNYENPNWPYEGDDPPMHYTRQMATLCFYF